MDLEGRRLVATSTTTSGMLDEKDNFHTAQGTTSEEALKKSGKVSDRLKLESRCVANSMGSSNIGAENEYWAVPSNRVGSNGDTGNQLEASKTELLDLVLMTTVRADNWNARLIENTTEMVADAEHGNSSESTCAKVDIVIQKSDLQQEWNVVGSDGKALRRSKRKVREIIKKKIDTKNLLRKITTQQNKNAMANNLITTTTKNNESTLQNTYILKKIIKIQIA
jgi:hypothetical protein